MKKVLLLLAVALTAVSCGISNRTRGSLYPKMYDEHPQVLLIMPPINNTASVEAKDYLYFSVNKPLCEAGYYVIPPYLAMDVLQRESAYDAELFFEQPLGMFGKYFGADAVVFSQINTWHKGVGSIHANIRYVIRSTHSDEVLFDRTCDMTIDLMENGNNNSLGGMLLDLAVTAVKTMASETIEAARAANDYIFRDLPSGRYSTLYQQDMEVSADRPNSSVTLRR